MCRSFFFGLQMQSFPCPGRGNNPLPTPSARSLNIMMNISETACLKLDVIVLPLAIWRKSYSINLCPKYASETGFFRAPNAKCSLPWEGGHPPLRPSLAVLLGGPLTRTLERGKKNESVLVTGLHVSGCLVMVRFGSVATEEKSKIWQVVNRRVVS